jgi:hypothetical protein
MEAIQQQTAIAERPESWGKKVEECRRVIAKEERDLSQAEKRLDASRDRIKEIDARRAFLLIPARKGGAPEAQAEIDQLYEERKAVDRNVEDDQEVIEQLTLLLKMSRRNLAVAEWEQRRAVLREVLRKRAESTVERQLMTAASEVKRLAAELARMDQETRLALLAFDSGLGREAKDLARLDSRRNERLAAEFKEIIPSQLNSRYLILISGSSLETQTKRVVETILAAVDCMGLEA